MSDAVRYVPKLAVALGLVISAAGLSCSADSTDKSSSDGGSAPATAPADVADGGSTTTVDPTDFEATAADFVHLDDMTPVRGFFVDNRLGQLDEAVTVAESPDGGVYPVGTIIQLVPQEAMVKRRAGYLPEFADWEFFILEPTTEGTQIVSRGGSEIVNRFGGGCAACHAKADVEFDMVCEDEHGCDPLPIGDDVFTMLRETDPRQRMTVGDEGRPTTTAAPEAAVPS